MIRMIPDTNFRVRESRYHTQTIQWLAHLRSRQSSKFPRRGVDIDRLGQLRGMRTGLYHARCSDNQRYMVRQFVIDVLRPHAHITEHIAVIAPEYDDRIFIEAKRTKLIQHLAYLSVYITYAGVIAVYQLTSKAVWEGCFRNMGRNGSILIDFHTVFHGIWRCPFRSHTMYR